MRNIAKIAVADLGTYLACQLMGGSAGACPTDSQRDSNTLRASSSVRASLLNVVELPIPFALEGTSDHNGIVYAIGIFPQTTAVAFEMRFQNDRVCLRQVTYGEDPQFPKGFRTGVSAGEQGRDGKRPHLFRDLFLI